MLNIIYNIIDVLEFCNILDLQNFIYSKRITKETYDFFKRQKKIFIDKYFIPEIINNFRDRLLYSPIIKFEKKFLKSNYYSNINSNDIISPISFGITNMNVPFIIIKYNEYNFNLSINSVKTALIIKRNNNIWSCAFSLLDNLPDISCIDYNKEYYLYYDDINNIYKKSITNEIIKEICKGDVIFTQNKLSQSFIKSDNFHFIEYSLV